MTLRPSAFSFEDVDTRVLGVIGLALLAALGIGAYSVGALGLLEDRYTMSGVFRSSGKLKAGDPVRVAGVEVGAVTDVQPDFDHGVVVVTWEVAEGVRLGTETRAGIETATLLGALHISLSGPVEPPYLADLPSRRRRIPLERTSEPVSAVNVLSSATRTAQEIDAGAVNDAIRELRDVATATGDDLGSLLDNLRTVSAAINQRKDKLRSLVANSRTITRTLASRDRELIRLLETTDVLLDELTARRDRFHRLLGDTTAIINDVSGLINDNREELSQIIADLRATLAVTDEHRSELNTSLAWLGPTFAQVATVTDPGPWFNLVLYQLGPLTALEPPFVTPVTERVDTAASGDRGARR